MVSEICEAFGCLPDEAERQEWRMVQAILDYRAAKAARDAFNNADKKQGFEVLKNNPHLLEVLSMMRRAQDGRPLHGDPGEGMAVAEAYRTAEESE